MTNAASPLATLYDILGYEPNDRVFIACLDSEAKWKNYPSTPANADRDVAAATERTLNAYFMVNRSGHPEDQPGRGGATAVTQLMALYADIDVKPGGMPSWEAAGDLIDSLSRIIGREPAAVVNSGHGLQPYWPLDDEQVTSENRTEVMGLVERWGTLVRMQAQLLGGSADSVYDLPRVLRAPGGTNFKAEPIPVTLHVSGVAMPYSLRELADVLDEWGVPAASVVNMDEKLAAITTWPRAVDGCNWFDMVLAQKLVAEPAARHPWMLGAAIEFVSAARNGCMPIADAVTAVYKVGDRFAQLLATGTNPRTIGPREVSEMLAYAIRFVEALTDEQVREQVGHHVHMLPEATSPFGDASESAPPPDPAKAAEEDMLEYSARVDPCGDAGLAYATSKTLAGRYLLTPAGSPLVWTGTHWAEDHMNTFEAAFQHAVAVYARGLYSTRAATPKDIAKMNSAAGSSGGERLLRRWNRLVVDPMTLNAVAEELCTPGGIVDLRTGGIRPAVATRDLNTQITAQAPDGRTPSGWLAFLRRVVVDQERIDYLQRLLGSTLVGDQRWPDLPIFVGRGANGKTVILRLLRELMAGYAISLPENFLVATSGTTHPTELADLRGVRLATLSEVSPHAHFDESRTKSITGGDPIRARKMGKDFEEFLPTHTLLIALNTLLQIKSGGDSLFRRFRVLTFDVQIPEDERDEMFGANLLREEGGRILSWLIEGARLAINEGMKPPRRVTDDTLTYRYEEDHLANFATEEMVPKPDGRISRADLMVAYTQWCRRNVQEALSSAVLFRELPQKIDFPRADPMQERGYFYGYVLADTARSIASGFIQPTFDPSTVNPDA